jgi:hypothetical protein
LLHCWKNDQDTGGAGDIKHFILADLLVVPHLLSLASSSGIQTLDLSILVRLVYHYAAATDQLYVVF